MNIRILVLALFINLVSIAQTITDKELIGTWKTTEITVLPFNEEFSDKIPTLKSIFTNSTFTFKTNHSFYISTQMKEMDDMFSNKFWTINKNKNLVMVIDNKNSDINGRGLIEIEVKKINEGLIFNLQDAPLELKMTKQ